MTEPANLRVSRFIRAPRAKVFEAWIRPELMKKWFCPERLTVVEAEADPRPGGRYLIAMLEEERGKVFTAAGVYREVIPHERLVFSWSFDQPGQRESLVTVEFRERGEGTEVTVIHERVIDMEGEETHEQGWTSALANLEKKIFQA